MKRRWFTRGYNADIAGRELTSEEGQDFLQKPCQPEQILKRRGSEQARCRVNSITLVAQNGRNGA